MPLEIKNLSRSNSNLYGKKVVSGVEHANKERASQGKSELIWSGLTLLF